jgi:hypothetical protein
MMPAGGEGALVSCRAFRSAAGSACASVRGLPVAKGAASGRGGCQWCCGSLLAGGGLEEAPPDVGLQQSVGARERQGASMAGGAAQASPPPLPRALAAAAAPGAPSQAERRQRRQEPPADQPAAGQPHLHCQYQASERWQAKPTPQEVPVQVPSLHSVPQLLMPPHCSYEPSVAAGGGGGGGRAGVGNGC